MQRDAFIDIEFIAIQVVKHKVDSAAAAIRKALDNCTEQHTPNQSCSATIALTVMAPEPVRTQNKWTSMHFFASLTWHSSLLDSSIKLFYILN